MSNVMGRSVADFKLPSVVELFSSGTRAGLSLGNGGKGFVYPTPEDVTSMVYLQYKKVNSVQSLATQREVAEFSHRGI